MARSASWVRTTGSSARGVPPPGRGPAVPHQLVEHPRVTGGSGLVLLARGRGRRRRTSGSGCRRSRTTPACQPWLRSPSIRSAGTRTSSMSTRFWRPSARLSSGRSSMPGDVHRREEVADALVPLRVVGIGARRDDEPVAVVARGAERLLPVDHPLVTVEHRTRAQRREVGTGVRARCSPRPT